MVLFFHPKYTRVGNFLGWLHLLRMGRRCSPTLIPRSMEIIEILNAKRRHVGSSLVCSPANDIYNGGYTLNVKCGRSRAPRASYANDRKVRPRQFLMAYLFCVVRVDWALLLAIQIFFSFLRNKLLDRKR